MTLEIKKLHLYRKFCSNKKRHKATIVKSRLIPTPCKKFQELVGEISKIWEKRTFPDI